MGLQLSHTTPYGLICAEAYWRIKRMQIEIEKTMSDDETPVEIKSFYLTGGLEIFVTKADCDKAPIGGGNFRYLMDMDSDSQSNAIAEGYKWLKTQSDFADAIDA
tara:strand:+ start:96 stop:410 length:315 start_codon:yes stop_codon:yes gene_type:complete